MTPDRKFLYTSVAALAMAFYAANAVGAGNDERIATGQTAQEEMEMVPHSSFDANNDGVVTASEAGDRLFYLFDTDGNEVLDNIEWNVDLVYTQIPVQAETFTFVDTDRDGSYEVGDYKVTHHDVITPLARYDEDGNGLSPQEFVDATFLEMDDNDDKAVTINEWRDAYLSDKNESFD